MRGHENGEGWIRAMLHSHADLEMKIPSADTMSESLKACKWIRMWFNVRRRGPVKPCATNRSIRNWSCWRRRGIVGRGPLRRSGVVEMSSQVLLIHPGVAKILHTLGSNSQKGWDPPNSMIRFSMVPHSMVPDGVSRHPWSIIAQIWKIN